MVCRAHEDGPRRKLLRNERVSIGDERGSFDSRSGIDDHDARRHGGASDVAAAVRGRDESRELVLLAHQPRSAFDADAHGVGLQLSGHTHGGQIWPWKYFVYLQQPVVAGLGKGRQNARLRELGHWVLGPTDAAQRNPREITRIVLERVARPDRQDFSGEHRLCDPLRRHACRPSRRS